MTTNQHNNKANKPIKAIVELHGVITLSTTWNENKQIVQIINSENTLIIFHRRGNSCLNLTMYKSSCFITH